MDKKTFILKLTCTTFILLFAFNLYSQTNISSPYSRFGIGQIHQNNNVKTLSMGNTGIAYKANDLINIANPASYTGFDTTSFVFEGGINGVLSQLKTPNNTLYTNNIALNYLLFGFAASKCVSFSFGLLPFSNMAYNMSDSSVVSNVGSTNALYNGEGGFNKFYGGTAVKITKQLALGANMSYLFGQNDNTRTLTFPEGANLYSIREVNSIRVSDLIFDFGLIYEHKLNNNNILSLGLVSGLMSKVNAKQTVLSETFSGINYGINHIKDTIVNTINSGNIIIPPFYGGGIAFKNGQKWMLGIDYKYQQWSKYASFGIADSLKNAMSASLGFVVFPSQTHNVSLLRKSTYSMGLRVAQTYLNLNNTAINEFGISFGVRFPLQKSRSTINLGFEIGQRGTTVNNLIKENYALFSCSLSIYERWFIRRKFD